MGLLSDPENGSAKWLRVLKKIHGPLCFLCYAGALVWFVMLARREFNDETYFSENALLPGLVTNEFNGEQSAKKYYTEFLTELEDKYEDTMEMPVPWLVGKLSQLHMEVYTHNFTLKYPFGQGQMYQGTNVYGILRAPRTASLEAIVVSAPYRPLSSHEKGTAAGIALMMAFAEFARPKKYWAKDIIFLFTEYEQLGMQAWLEAYHGIHSNKETFYDSLGSFWKPGDLGKKMEKFLSDLGYDDSNEYHKCLNPGTLKGRSGSIQAAINLEIHDPKIKYIEVKIEGLNGQLPNLDLVNLVNKLCVKSGLHHSFKNSYSWMRSRSDNDWLNSFKTMMSMVTAQMAGVPNGNHGLFHRFGIEALTLEGRDAHDPAGPAPKVHTLSPANFYRLGVALESILRSLNNLLERFHQSFFFYLLASTNRFISIGQYIPSLCALCGAMLIRALSLWVSLQQTDDDDEVNKSKKAKKGHKTSKSDGSADEKTDMGQIKEKQSDSEVEVPEKKQDTEEKQEDEKTSLRHRKRSESKVLEDNDTKEPKKRKHKKKGDKNKDESKSSIVNIGGNYLMVHLIGYSLIKSLPWLVSLGEKYFDFHSEVSIYYGLLIISAVLVLVSPFLPRFLSPGRITRDDMSLMNILALVELSTTCLTVGMHNFPLGLVLGTVYTPLALIAGVVVKAGEDSVTSTPTLLKRIFCLLLHPLCIITLSMMAYSRVLVPEESWLSGAERGRDAAMQAVMFSIVDSFIYGNWLFNVMCMVLFPTWIIFWQILNNEVDP